MEGIIKETISGLEGQGYRGGIVSIEHLHDLKEEIGERHRLGSFCEEFYQERLTWFQFSPPDTLPRAKTVIVVAVPDPQTQVAFSWEGKQVATIVPPTYLHWREINGKIKNVLAQLLRPRGFQVVEASLPVKLLAVHAGLGAYGRNNVCYLEGMGSFHRLAAFYSDLPCEDHAWQEVEMMQPCKKCIACLRKCPTGAITADRFLLHAERCITFHNEKPRGISFPTWMHPSWHNCLVGCLHCQWVCPENRNFLEWVVQGDEFSQEETTLLLQGMPLDRLPSRTVKKLKQMDLVDYLDVVPRNLSALLQRESTA